MYSMHKKQTASILSGLALLASACGGQLLRDSALEPRDGEAQTNASVLLEEVAVPTRQEAVDLQGASFESLMIDVDGSELLRSELRTTPSLLVGPHGVSDASAYVGLQGVNLSTFPQVGGDPIQAWEYGFLRIRDPKQLVASARLAIRGEIVDFALPRFNSDTGGYWTPGLHEEPGIVDIANEIWREVQIRVTEVLGDALGAGVGPGDTVVFISRGGQLRVEPSDVADAPGNRGIPDMEHPHEIAASAPFVVRSTPPVELTKGEDVLLLLDWNKFKGLYTGSYGYRYELMPANEILYKYVVKGDTAVNIGDPEGPLTMSLNVLQELIAASLGTAAGDLPRPGVFPADPHPPADPTEGALPDDIDEPDHTHGE